MMTIYEAAANGKFEIVRKYQKDGADINEPDDDGYTPLHWASQFNQSKIVMFLLKYGANIDALDCSGFSPIEVAIANGNTTTANLLLDKNCETSTIRDGFNLLHAAAAAGQTEILKRLLDSGLDVNKQTDDEETPLHWATQENHAEVVKILLEKGASPNLKDSDGYSPVHIASSGGKVELLQYFSHYGADFEVRCESDDNGTPLHNACAWSQVKAVQFLLEQNVNVNVMDDEGRTPLHFAEEKKNIEIIELLKSAGALK